MNNQSGSNKHPKSPLVMQSGSRMHSRTTAALPSDACRRLDLSATSEKTPLAESNPPKREAELVESLVKILVDRMLDAKENIDVKLVASLCNGDLLPLLLSNFVKEGSSMSPHSTSTPTESDVFSAPESSKCAKKDGGQVTQAEMFIEARQSRKGKEVDEETQTAVPREEDHPQDEY